MFADFQTHLVWLRRFTLQQVMAIFPFRRAQTVSVLAQNGLMAGMSIAFEGDALQIGAGMDCDVQLLDDGVKDLHATVRLHGSIFGTLAEVSAHEPLSLGTHRMGPEAASGLQRLPLIISLGAATLRIGEDQRSAKRWQRASNGMMVAMLFGIAAAAIMLSVNQIVRTAQIDSVKASVLAPPALLSSGRPDSLAVTNDRLAQLGLASDVHFVVGEGGSISSQGKVPAVRWQSWQSYLAWYDQQPDLPTLVNTVTMAPQLVSLQPIANVQLHAPMTVFFVSGDAKRVGDVLAEGWMVKAIDAEGLTLERGTDTTRVQF